MEQTEKSYRNKAAKYKKEIGVLIGALNEFMEWLDVPEVEIEEIEEEPKEKEIIELNDKADIRTAFATPGYLFSVPIIDAEILQLSWKYRHNFYYMCGEVIPSNVEMEPTCFKVLYQGEVINVFEFNDYFDDDTCSLNWDELANSMNQNINLLKF